jgi:glutamyl-Q tRNA(Asp) synthetase
VSTYTGRFAPTPSGPLHEGSLLTALASYLDARANQGTWLLRMDDLDTPRNQAGAAEKILSTLDQHGLHWDASVVYQSQRTDAYQSALSEITRCGHIFSCQCSRKYLRGLGIYPGTCSHQTISTQYFKTSEAPAALRKESAALRKESAALNVESTAALRVRVDDKLLCIKDLIQGPYEGRLDHETGDFIVFRKDAIFGYHLTATVDDDYQRISHIIRGADLLQSSLQQLYLGNLLGLKIPCYGHIPVIVDDRGHKLSKHSLPEAMDATEPSTNLTNCLTRLGQNPPMELQYQPVASVIKWGIENWDIDLIPRIRSFPFEAAHISAHKSASSPGANAPEGKPDND